MTKQERNIREIIHQTLGNVIINEYNGAYYARRSYRHEEGYDSTTVEVYVEDGNIKLVEMNNSQDCDGKYSSEGEYLVFRRKNRKRFYPSCYYDKGKKVFGKFMIKSKWRFEPIKIKSRDYQAERAGY